MTLLLLTVIPLLILAAIPLPSSMVARDNCPYIKNVSLIGGDSGPEVFSADEECLYYYLVEREQDITGDVHSIHKQPPPAAQINITVAELHVEHVELAKGSTFQFNIYGWSDITWSDSRLTWDTDKFSSISTLFISNPSQIWTPLMIDHALCTDSTTCDLTWVDVEIDSEGLVTARLHFRYASMCHIDFSKYPEEENTCCIYFTIYERNRRLRFTKMDDKTTKPRRPAVMKQSLDMDTEITRLNQDHSSWTLEEQSYGLTNILNMENLPALRVCVKAVKKMSTMKMALRLPVTIATLLMLVAPLFGDLRTQAYVKLITLCIQTVCFLYLCSMAPENGFAGQKPKIYRFYESVFGLTTVSMLITVCCMALSRAKRTVPPSHRVYLSAKLVNRAVCCIEPEDSAHYQRYLEQNENQQASSEITYTQDWRHIYMAVNNLISGLFFTTFLFFVLLDIM